MKVSTTLVIGIIAIIIGGYICMVNRMVVRTVLRQLYLLEIPAERYFITHHRFPSNVATLGGDVYGIFCDIISNPHGLYFEAIIRETYEIEEKDGTITTIVDDHASFFLDRNTVRLIFNPVSKTWTCSVNHPNGIPRIFLPPECQG